MHKRVFAIDLGASYTKLAYCPELANRSRKEADLLAVDRSVLIPSVAIHTGRKDRNWLFGAEAAQTKPGSHAKVYSNWKADLFRPDLSESTAAAILVAGNFFAWLRTRLDESGLNLDTARVRLALPAFPGMDKKASVIAQVMALNGWRDMDILKVTEPRANMLGLFTQGRNYMGREGNMQFMGMYGEFNPYIRRARERILYDSKAPREMRMLVVDVGAFTTDAALITYDVSADDDGVTHIKQNSWPYGIIDQLDADLIDEILATHKLSRTDLSFEEIEHMKQQVYAGKTYVLPTESGETIEIGGAHARSLVSKRLEAFADQVFEKVQVWMEADKAEYLYLTGGGSAIERIAHALRKSFRTAGVHFQSIPDPDPKKDSDAVKFKWHETGESLSRLATAVGGVSLILDAPPSRVAPVVTEADHTPPRRERSGPITCRCNGGNKDCCFCAGRGYYERL